MVDTGNGPLIGIVHVLGSIRPSGMERMLVSGQEYFAARGYRTIVIAQGTDHPFAGDLAAAGCEVVFFERPISDRRSQARLRALLGRSEVGLVHLHTEARYLPTLWALQRNMTRRRLPIIRTFHNIFSPRGVGFLKRRLQALLADPTVTAFVAPTHEVAVNERRFGRNSIVITNWVADEYFTIERAPRDPITMTIVGNCSSVKNHEFALDLALRLGHHVAHLGQEETMSPLERSLLERLDREGLVHRRGPEDPRSALSEATYFVMPSHYEGMGVALAEAIAARVPAVAASTPGLTWARGFQGVESVPLDPDLWELAIQRVIGLDMKGLGPAIEIAAATGAGHYSDVYDEALDLVARPVVPPNGPSTHPDGHL